jgi:hypothetical protein
MVTFNWDCTTVEVMLTEGDLNNVVYNVEWILTGISDQLDAEGEPYTAFVEGQQKLNTSNITEFISFNDLTNEIVTQWVKDAMGPIHVSIQESNIRNNIEAQINPVTAVMKIQN